MRIRELLELAEIEGFSLETEISIMGAEIHYVKFFIDENGNEKVLLDEVAEN